MASKTRLQAKAAKARRQKMFAIGGSMLLAVILVIQVPRTMKMLGGGSSSTASTETSARGVPTPPDEAGQPISTRSTDPGRLPDRNAQPEAGEGQLTSFELFAAKDPFVQQVADKVAPEAAAAGSATGGPGGGPTSAVSTSTTSRSEGATPAGSTSGAQASRTTSSVSISVNGQAEAVRVSQNFPASDPTFRLVSSGANFVKISIAGGKLADGAQTVTLKLGKKLTLVNTADGTRYELELRSTG